MRSTWGEFFSGSSGVGFMDPIKKGSDGVSVFLVWLSRDCRKSELDSLTILKRKRLVRFRRDSSIKVKIQKRKLNLLFL